jgi:hypothetical protein
VTPRDLRRWRASKAKAHTIADQNQSRLLEQIALQVDTIDGMSLGMVPLASGLKASVIFAANLKPFVAQLGWPVLAVIPCRDFIYLIAEKDQALLGRMGTVVQREYRGSGYPITTEALRIADDGITAIGKFPE